MRQIARNNRNKCSRVNFATINKRFSGLLCLQGGRNGGGAFLSQCNTGEEFLHQREQTKIKLFTDLRGIRSTCGAEE